MALRSDTFSPTQLTIAPRNAAPQEGDTGDMLAAKLSHVLSGGSGAEVVNDTDSRNTSTIGFIVLTETVFAAVTAADGYTATNLTDVSFPAGTTLPFRFSSWTLASGTVLAILC